MQRISLHLRPSLKESYTEFLQKFHLLTRMTNELTVSDFDDQWQNLKNTYLFTEANLKYFDFLYSLKEKWAAPFLHRKFCANTTTTQRAESMNFLMKQFLGAKTHLVDFIEEFKKSVEKETARLESAITKQNSAASITKFHLPIEKHAQNVLSSHAFHQLESELEKAITVYKISETLSVSTV
jgi:hypothetical protein